MTPTGASARMEGAPLRPFARLAVCPSCERYIGVAARCPYCDAESARGPFVPALRRGILPLATLALLALLAFARLRAPPVVALDVITPAMNFASVRVCGRVARVSSESRFSEGPYLSFQLTDAGGMLRVAMDSPAAADLARLAAVPRAGARLDVGGTLQYRCGQRPLLRVHSARQVRVLDPGPRRGARARERAHG